MPVVQVGKVRMAVDKRCMTVAMAVGLSGRILGPMAMLVMGVVPMAMLMLDGIMNMLMAMTFHEVQIKTNSHENGGNPKANTRSF